MVPPDRVRGRLSSTFEGGEQRCGAVPLVVMGHGGAASPSSAAGRVVCGRGPGSASSRRSTAPPHAPVAPRRGRQCRVSLSAKAGSFESLNRRQRCGARPCACQIVRTVEAATPATCAIARSVQCVASPGRRGVGQPHDRPPPAAGDNRLPFRAAVSCRGEDRPRPLRMKRSCQRQTHVFDFPVAAMIAIVPRPSALARMIRARHTCFCALLRSSTIARKRARSSAETVKETPRRIATAP